MWNMAISLAWLLPFEQQPRNNIFKKELLGWYIKTDILILKEMSLILYTL